MTFLINILSENKDIYSRRNGHAPNENMKKVLTDTIAKAKDMISKKLVDQKVEMTLETVQEAISVLKGAVMIVYPMVIRTRVYF